MPRPLPSDVFEGIRRMAEEEPNRSKIARMFNVSPGTVYKALGKANPEMQRQTRHEAMGRMASTMIDRIEELLDTVKEIPENASYQQKMVAIGILTDKVEKLDKRLAESKIEDVVAALPLPETIEALAGAIRNELRALGPMLNVVPVEVVAEVKRTEAATGQRLLEHQPIREAQVESIDDLDGANG